MNEKRFRILKNRCRVPKKFIELKISDMKRDSSNFNYSKILEYFQIISDNELKTGKFLDEPIFHILNGKFGTGKTRIACYLLKQAYLGMKEKWFNSKVDRFPLFMKTNEIVEYRHKSFDSDDEHTMMRERIFDSLFLVIDDIGKISDFKGEMLFIERVIENRYNNDLSTIITSNIDSSLLPPRFKDFMSNFKRFTLISKTREERNNEQ